MAPDYKAYGVKERLAARDRIDVHVQELQLQGFTVVDGGFTPQQIASFRDKLDRLLPEQARKAGGIERLRKVGEHETLRCPLAVDPGFLAVAANPAILGLCRKMLGDYFILMQQNGISLSPQSSHHQSAYHRDLPYQHFVSSRPLAINALLALDDFDAANGATLAIAGSHKVEGFPSDEVVGRLERPIEAKAGSYLVLDSMTYHRGGRNTTGTPRRAVNNVYVLPFLKQQIALPRLLGGKYGDDPALARLLGYDSDPPASLEEWWAGRDKRAGY